MQYKLFIAAAIVLSFSTAAWSAEAKDGEAIQGDWLPAEAELAGHKFPDEVRKAIRLVIKDDTYTATVGKEPDRGTIKLKPAEKPKALDVIGVEGPNKGKTFPAIYELDGDTWRICYDLSGKSRPTEFKTKADSLLFLVTYKREKPAGEAGIGKSFKGPIGLQLYSLRAQLGKDAPGTLAKVREMGFTNVETAGTYGLTPEKFKAELESHGLKAVSGHFPYARFRDDLEGVVRDAKALGEKYAGCAWIDHGDTFDEKTCREAIAVFNKAGERLAKEGIRFFYHTHGYEFRPHNNGTLFDLMMSETNPKYVAYEMDVFWVAHGGEKPSALLEKYPNRFELMHLKDMKRGTETGLFTGKSDVANDVALGTGQLSFPPVLKAAAKAGVKWYFIEDESPSSVEQIPISLKYLEQVKW
jgi:uncharacterized protein (TIGR03067 family)